MPHLASNHSQQHPARSRKSEIATLILVLISLFYFLLFLPTLTNNAVPYFMDIVAQFFPIKFLTAQMILGGELPLWNPTYFCGVPLLANPQWGTLYPGYVLFYLIPSGWMFSLTLILHAIAGAWGIYLLTHLLLNEKILGLAAAVCFLFQGWMWSHYAFGAYLLCIAWIPFFLLCCEYFFLSGQKKYLILGGILLALQIYSGAPQVTFYALLCYSIIIVVRMLTGHKELKRNSYLKQGIAFLFFTMLIGAALSCPQWLSSLAFLKECQRAGGLGPAQVAQGALSPEGFLRALIGGTGLPEDAESCLYLGLVALTLVILALIKIKSQPSLIGYLIVVIFFVLLTLRELSGLFYSLFPPYRHFHDPRRALVVLAVIMPVFTAQGIKAIIADKLHRSLLLYSLILFLIIGISFLLGIFPLKANFELATALGWLKLPSIISPALLSIGLALIIGLVTFWKRRLKKPGWIVAIFIAVFLLDMTYFALQRIDLKFVSTNRIFDNPFARAIGEKKQRFLAYDNTIHYSYDYTRPTFNYYLFPDCASYYGLEDFQGYDPFIPRRYGLYLRLINKGMISLYPRHFGIVRNLDSTLLARANLGLIIGDAHYYHPFMKEFLLGEELQEIRLENPRAYNQLTITTSVQNPDIVLLGEEVARLILTADDGKQRVFPIKMGEHTGPGNKKFTGLAEKKEVKVITSSFADKKKKFLYTARIKLEPAMIIKSVLIKRASKLAQLWIEDIAFRPATRAGMRQWLSNDTEYGQINVYALPATFPRLEFVQRINPVYTIEEAANILIHPLGIPREIVIVEADEKLRKLAPRFSTDAIINSASFEASKIAVNATVKDSPAFLVLRDAYFPSWHVKIDGHPVRMYPVDLLFRGVVVDKGTHNIEFCYSPAELKIGSIIFLLSALLLLLWAKPGSKIFSPRSKDRLLF